MSAVTAHLNAFVAPADTVERPARLGLFQLVVRALVDARRRQADREVTRLIERSGGRMTDALERQIEKHFV